jgi:hypothetical protein
MVKSQLGDEEVLLSAGVIGGIRARETVPSDCGAANRTKQGHAEVKPVTHKNHPRRVGRSRQAILRKRDPRTSLALLYNAVARRKVGAAKSRVRAKAHKRLLRSVRTRKVFSFELSVASQLRQR